MYIKNSNFVIYLVAAAIVGFGASFLFAAADFQNGLGSGDISKASRYNNVKEDPDVAVVVEKLQNDTAFFNQTKASIDYLKTRVSSLAILTEETARLCNDIPELSSNVPAMNSLSAKACNTSSAFDAVSGSLELIADGKKAPAYEQAANNAYIGFQKIENQMEAGKVFVESASKYLEDKNLEENSDLAGVVALWSVYSAQDAVLMENEENMKYWSSKIASDAVATQALSFTEKSFNGPIQNMISQANLLVGDKIQGFLNKSDLVSGNLDLLKNTVKLNQDSFQKNNPLNTLGNLSGGFQHKTVQKVTDVKVVNAIPTTTGGRGGIAH